MKINAKGLQQNALKAIKANMRERMAGRLAPKPPQAPHAAMPPAEGDMPAAPAAPTGTPPGAFTPEEMELLKQRGC